MRADMDDIQLGSEHYEEADNVSDLEVSIRDQLWMSMEALEKRTREAITRMGNSPAIITSDGKPSTLVEDKKKIIEDNHKANLVTIDEVKQMLKYQIFMDQLALNFRYVPKSVIECFIDEMMLLREDVRGKWRDIEDRNANSEAAINCIKSFLCRGFEALDKSTVETTRQETD